MKINLIKYTKSSKILTISFIVLFLTSVFLMISPLNVNVKSNERIIQPKVAGGIWTVDDDGSANFNTIQDAINSATSEDTILVYPGTYIENIIVDKPLNIKSQKGPEFTIVKAAESTIHVFNVTANYVIIDGFTIKDTTGGYTDKISGIYLKGHHCRVSNNTIENHYYGIYEYSSPNTIVDNAISLNTYGIYLGGYGYNYVANNTITNNNYAGISIRGRYNKIINNSLLGNVNSIISDRMTYSEIKNNSFSRGRGGQEHIVLGYKSNENTIMNNIFLDTNAIRLSENSNNNLITQNTIIGPDYWTPYGIFLDHSSNNIISDNILENSKFIIQGNDLFHYNTHTIEGNIMDGDPLYYYKDISDLEVPEDASQVILANCNNMLVENIKSSYGIEVYYTNNSKISNNYCLISLLYSYNNIITNNTVSSQSFQYSTNNRIYLNNFIDNKRFYYESNNIWNSFKTLTYTYKGTSYTNYLGNYWDDYTGNDVDGDGIGDSPYSIDGDSDNYPLMEPLENYFLVLPSENQPPTLSNGYVDQPSGSTSTTFNYYVAYTDPDGDAPIMKYVYLDGSPYKMTEISGNYVSGATFRYSTTLSTGSHNFYFDFDDGHGHSTRFPTFETINEPYVNLDESGLVFGTAGGLLTLDPQFAWDFASDSVIDQVCEGLYAYDLSDPNLAIIPNLAAANGTWSSDKLNYTVPLREDVIFHDGTPFNASAVKWSFDRLNYFLNVDVGKTIFEELYVYKGEPIINRIEVINDYTVRFVLNEPYVPFQALLCFSGSYILSPASTPEKQYIDTTTGDLVGTGPFVYDGYTPDVEVRFHAFEDYWAGAPDIKTLVFSIIPDANERNQALLAGNIDLITDPSFSMLDTFEADPDITVVEAEQDLTIFYLGMNNKQINKTMRQAISFALDYDFIIEEIMRGQSARMKSPIPEGILYANWGFDVATMNVPEARIRLVNGGVCNFDVDDDAQWLDAALNNPLATYNYTYNLGNYARENIGLLLHDNLAKIGIKVELKGMNWYDYVDRLYNFSDGHNKLQLYLIGWIADYIDPSNYINPLFSNTSESNTAQVNDPKLQGWMEQALTEFDSTIRKQLYDQIQQYIVEDLMPWAFCYVEINRDAYRSDIIGFQSNPMGRVRFYGVTRLGLNQPPTCVIELQKGGVEISEINVGEFFDIYVGNSTDDIGIEEIRFSSDDEQDGIATGEWTEWYNWDITSGDWNADTKIKRWSFDTLSEKEVWVEINDSEGESDYCHKNIFNIPGYAIIVAGARKEWSIIPWDEYNPILFDDYAINYAAETSYKVLRNLGFDDDHIYYLNSRGSKDIDGDNENEVDASCTPANFENSINEVKNKIKNCPTIPIVIYFVGHGLVEQFLCDPKISDMELISIDLSVMLDQFSPETPILISMDCCYSESFITIESIADTQTISNPSYPKRIIITSELENKELYPLRMLHYNYRLWNNLNKGLNVKEAFITDINEEDINHMRLDDNGDRIGSPPNNLGEDGIVAQNMKIGIPNSEDFQINPWEYILLASPGELRVYDSQNRVSGLVNGEIKTEIPDSIYDDEYKIVVIFNAYDSYYYEVVGTEVGAYGLSIASIDCGKIVTFTASDIPISEESTHQYNVDWAVLSQGEESVNVKVDSDGDGIFEQIITADNDLTFDEFQLQTETIVDFDPDTLNLKSKGKWVTVYIELPVGFDVNEINITTITLNGEISAELKPTEIGDYDGDGIPDLMVKLNRTAVQNILEVGGNVEIIISGRLIDKRLFEGKDIIKVIDKGNGKIKGNIESGYLEGYYITSGYSVEWILILLLGFFGIGLIIIKERKIIF